MPVNSRGERRRGARLALGRFAGKGSGRARLRVCLLLAVLAAVLPAEHALHTEPARAQETGTPDLTSPPSPTSTPIATELPSASPTVPSPTATETQTDSATPAVTATPTPPVDPDVVTATIDASGGSITSSDGRVTIEFPEDATPERLRVTIRPRDPHTVPVNADHRWLGGTWDFEAAAIDRSWVPVENFNEPLALVLRPSERDLEGLMWHSVTMYRLDPATDIWVPLPTELTAHREWRATTTHFSTYGPGADGAVHPAVTDQASVNLNSGAAQLALPIALPPGRAGFAPQLTLTYSSAAVNEMKSRWSMGSWVGVGFNLDLPHITQSSLQGTTRYFLNLNGVSDEIVEVPGNKFRLKREHHLKIKKSCAGGPSGQACWTVMDKGGSVYVFGGTTDSYRYWNDGWECWFGACGGNPPPKHPYRWDLSKATDVYGNNFTVQYAREMSVNHWQFAFEAIGMGTPSHPYVIASYPTTLTYNAGTSEEVRVNFETGYDVAHTDTKTILPYSQTLYVRNDNGYIDSGPCNASFPSYPYVVDTKYLSQIDVFAKNANASGAMERARRYTFAYEATAGCSDVPPGNPAGAGDLTLSAMTLWDRDLNASTARTVGFTYQGKPIAFDGSCTKPDGDPCSYTRPFLTTLENALGGLEQFTYSSKPGGSTTGYWNRQVLVFRSDVPVWGASNATLTQYSYSAYPDHAGSGIDAQFKGFGEATEADFATGHYTVHEFYTVASGNTYEPREGLEYETRSYDSADNLLRKTQRYLTATHLADAVQSGVDPVNYVSLDREDTWLEDGATILLTDWVTTDETGASCSATSVTCEVTQVLDRGLASTSLDNRTTQQEFHAVYNEANNLFLVRPKWTKTFTGDGTGGPLEAMTAFYYDGASGYGTPPTKGILTATRATEQTSPSTTYVCQYFEADSFGNPRRASVPTTYPEAETCPQATSTPLGGIPSGVPYSETVYDADFSKFPLTVKQPFVNVALETTTAKADFDFVLGTPEKVTQPNGNVIEYAYDGFGRVTAVRDAVDASGAPTVSVEYGWGSAPNWTRVTRKTGEGTSTWELRCFDGFGRKVQTITPYSASQDLVSGEVVFDGRGLMKKAFLPRTVPAGTQCASPNEANPGATYAYDALARRSLVTDAAGKQTQFRYDLLTAASIDANGHKTETVADGRGRTTATKEYTGTSPYTLYATTAYEYDALDSLTEVTDAQGNVTTMQYDMLGRKTAMSDPDMGAWTYAYDAAGNLTSQTDARGVTTTLAYDPLNRLTAKSWTGPISQDPVTFTYDAYPSGSPCGAPDTARGLLTKMDDDPGAESSCFDLRGQPVLWRRTVDATNYDVATTYDTAGRVLDLTYPGGEVLRHTYDAYHGGLTGICEWVSAACASGGTYLSGVTYTPEGMPDQLPLGNGLTTDYDYESSYPSRLSAIETGAVQDLAYTYDAAGNVKTIAGAVAGETVTYAYDDLNRLIGATGFAGGASAEYAYDTIGNMQRKREGALDLTLAYPDPGTARPHAVTQATHTGTTTAYKELAYDPNGNLDAVNGSESDVAFDAENRLTSRGYGAASTSYTYSGTGTLVKRTTAGVSGSESTVYVGGLYEKNLTTGGVTKSYQALGRIIAQREVPAAGGGEVRYLLADHLGGTVAVTDEAGAVVAQRAYWPYGGERAMAGDQRLTDRSYTGQREEDYDGLGLYFYNARFYSTTLGHFASADSLAVDGLNRYAYVRNNPIRYNDPTGYCVPDGKGGADCGVPQPPGTPVPENEAESACVADPLGCLVWSLGLEGVPLPDIGLAIMMGVGQGYKSWIEYYAFIQAFWDANFSSCAGEAAAACFNGFAALMKQGEGGALEAFVRYGVFIIPTTQEGWLGKIGGVAGAVVGRLPGYDSLNWFMTQQRYVEAGGVIGFSNGAAVVSQWFANHSESKVPFTLIEPYGFTINVTLPIGVPLGAVTISITLVDLRVVQSQIPRATRYFRAYSCAGGAHCEHEDAAADVIGAMFP